MPVTVDEAFQSRSGGSGDNPVEERAFIVRGSDDSVTIDTAVMADLNCPPTIGNFSGTLYRTGVEFREQLGGLLWRVTVRYEGSDVELAVGEKRVRWSTMGGMQRFLAAREHIAAKDGDGATVQPPGRGALGFDGRTVNGADVLVPSFSFEVDIALADITGLDATVLSLTGKTNNAAFYGFAAGEVLYIGASRNDRGNGIKDITHSFAAQPNRTNVLVAPSVTFAAIGGWHVISVAYPEPSASGGGLTIPKPSLITLDRVYDSGNMALLGVGTSE